MAVVAARFRVRLADEPDPTGAVRPHPARPRNLAAIFAPADRMRRSGVHGVRGRARGRRPRHRRAALHGRAAAFGSRRVRVAGRHRRARGARPARHRPPQQDKPGGRDQRRAVREGRRRPEGGLTEDAIIRPAAPARWLRVTLLERPLSRIVQLGAPAAAAKLKLMACRRPAVICGVPPPLMPWSETALKSRAGCDVVKAMMPVATPATPRVLDLINLRLDTWVCSACLDPSWSILLWSASMSARTRFSDSATASRTSCFGRRWRRAMKTV